MSSSGSGEQRDKRAAPAEQHLGDRLAAFVDGELTDDSRDRVQAHLVTCPQCKAAATEQRRLKSVVAASELPAMSAGLMARLHGMPGCGGGKDDGPRDPWSADDADGDAAAGIGESARRSGRGPFDGGLLGSGVFGPGRREEFREEFSYLTPAHDLVEPGSKGRGFRIHELTRAASGAFSAVGSAASGISGSGASGAERRAQEAQDRRQDADRAAAVAAAASGAAAASRSRRFAFAAAGAFSLAAIAIGGALPMEAAVDGGARTDDGPAVSPFSANSVADTRGATPRDLLDANSAGSPAQERLRRGPGVMASGLTPAASVSVTRPLTGVSGSSVPVLTPAVSPGQTFVSSGR